MGAKTWMLVYSDASARKALAARPSLDREATTKWASRLFPSVKLLPREDVDLSFTCPPGDDIHIGCFKGVSIVAAKNFGIDHPSKLPAPFLQTSAGATITLHAMHSVVDWFAYAIWENGRLIRSLSLSPESGVLEDIGAKLPFEQPYWAGQHHALDESEDPASYPFPFHPLDLGEAALAELFGYQLEGALDTTWFEPESIPLLRFQRARPFWKIWG